MVTKGVGREEHAFSGILVTRPCLCVRHHGEEKHPTLVDPIWKTTPPTAIPWLNCNWVASGSTVYTITKGSRICSVNAADLSSGWSAIQPSASRILYTRAAALDGKVYLSGAPLYDSDFTVAEVFDTNTNMFENSDQNPIL